MTGVKCIAIQSTTQDYPLVPARHTLIPFFHLLKLNLKTGVVGTQLLKGQLSKRTQDAAMVEKVSDVKVLGEWPLN